MGNVRAEKITTKLASTIWSQSENSTGFSNPQFLAAVCDQVDWWGGIKGDKCICAWPIPIDRTGRFVQVPFADHIGPVWSSELTELPHHRWFATSQKIYASMIEAILSTQSEVYFSLPIGCEDVRAFAWWNYGVENAPKFKIEPRYTALVNDLKNKSSDDLVGSFRSDDKRKMTRRLLKNPPAVEKVPLDTIKTVINLYENTMRRTGGKLTSSDLGFLERIVNYVSAGSGEVLCWAEKEFGSIVAVQVMLDSNGTSNAILQSVSEEWQKKGLSVWLNYQSILSARDRGNDVFDFNGANSPNRADDKHSFGADSALYFQLSYQA